jgi:DNA invertase Pin-like site-specific DNA recombinase
MTTTELPATLAKLNADQAALARRMKVNGETAATICRTLGIGRTTLYRYLAEDQTAWSAAGSRTWDPHYQTDRAARRHDMLR